MKSKALNLSPSLSYGSGPQFSAERRIFLSRAAEFAHFRGISMFSQNFAEFGTGQVRHILMEFGPPYCM